MIHYTYDESGLRTRKTVSGTVTKFDRDASGNLVHETRNNGTNHLYYYYDANGSISSISYNGIRYAFRKNLQGMSLQSWIPIVMWWLSIPMTLGVKILSITDANGNAITSSLHIANINPIRYRGYYDTETGLYYVSRRYYDPEVGRWISP